MDSLPATIKDTFPAAEIATKLDLVKIRRQLGREPTGEIFIARRCPRGRPAVIATMPSKTPKEGRHPPLLWLTCPTAARMAGSLESEGLMEEFARRLESDEKSRAAFQIEEDEYSRILEVVAAECGGDDLARRLENRGVAGGRKYRVKCLHAHLSSYLAREKGVLGEWSIGELENRGGIWCERIPPACVD